MEWEIPIEGDMKVPGRIFASEEFVGDIDSKCLEQVKNVYPMHIGNNSVTYRLDIRGNSKGLIQTIKLGNVLSFVI